MYADFVSTKAASGKYALCNLFLPSNQKQRTDPSRLYAATLTIVTLDLSRTGAPISKRGFFGAGLAAGTFALTEGAAF
jgi:hypothetical protein